jgi:tetratricopeptide (TPR) repeat protein
MLPGHSSRTFLGALRREDLLTEIALGPLDGIETTSLAEQLVGNPLDHATIATLQHETEGNPLFVVEMLRAGRVEHYTRGQHSVNTRDALLPPHLPPKIQTVLAIRLAQLSPLAHELANVAAVIGREFSFAILARASGKDEEMSAQGLDELWQRRIVREQGGDAYDFSHEKLREQTYTSQSAVRRRLLHRRVAEALEAVYAETLDSVSRGIAVHYERAGLTWKAIAWYQRAGEAASGIAATAEAIDAYRQAVTLIEARGIAPTQQDRHWETAVQVYTTLGDLFEIIGHMQDARQAYLQGQVHLPEHASLWQARLQRKIAKTWNHPSTLETLLQGYKQAEYLLEQAPDRSGCEWQQEWLDIQLDQILPLQVHRISVQEMTEVIEKMQPIVEQYGTEAQQAQFFLSTAARNMARDRAQVSEETITQFRSALQAVQQTRNTSFIGFARYGLGRALFLAGHLNEAEEQLRLAMNVGEEVGHVFLLDRCLSFLPFIFRQRGQAEEVRQVITRALSMQGMRQTGMLAAHRAWLAWRDGKMEQAEEYSKTALAEWQDQRQVNPHRWAALWPLIGVMLVQKRLSEAIHYVRMLLLPPAPPLSEELRSLLETMVQEWEDERHEHVSLLLQHVVPLAQEQGYL